MNDLAARDWDRSAAGEAGLRSELLPEVVASGAVAGRLCSEQAEALGLPPDIGVAAAVGDNQASIAFLSTFGPSSWPVQVAIDVLGSASGSTSVLYPAPGVEIEGNSLVHSTFELDVGVRRIWRTGRARPFVGGGLAVIRGPQEAELFLPPPIANGSCECGWFPPVLLREEDRAPGVWVDGGVFWRLGSRFNIGFEARLSRAELSFSDRKVEAGGFNLGLIVGWGWGGGARIVR